MGFIESNRNFKASHKCSDLQKVSFANLVSFPDDISQELYNDVFTKSDKTISEILISDSNFIIGGYIVQILSGYQVFFVKKIKINPRLKSNKYTQEVMARIIDQGLNTFDAKFKGIVIVSESNRKKKLKSEEDLLLKFGGILFYSWKKFENRYVRFIYLPANGGHDSDEAKEIFSTICIN